MEVYKHLGFDFLYINYIYLCARHVVILHMPNGHRFCSSQLIRFCLSVVALDLCNEFVSCAQLLTVRVLGKALLSNALQLS